MAIKEIENQLIDANKILLDINSKIKDVFKSDTNFEFEHSKLKEFRTKNRNLEKILTDEMKRNEILYGTIPGFKHPGGPAALSQSEEYKIDKAVKSYIDNISDQELKNMFTDQESSKFRNYS